MSIDALGATIKQTCQCCGQPVSDNLLHLFNEQSGPYTVVCDNCWKNPILFFPDKEVKTDGLSYPQIAPKALLDGQFKKWQEASEKTTLKVLLVEPNYYTRFPPLGLLKLSSFHKARGDIVEMVRSPERPNINPDIIYVTSLFTYAWKPVHEAVRFYKKLFPNVKLVLGGVYASLLPQHAMVSGADFLALGIDNKLDNIIPDYSVIKKWNWDSNIVFSSRGCIRNCSFCAIPKIEGKLIARSSILEIINNDFKKIVFWDNNFLASPHKHSILNELAENKYEVDFNQGLDARLITSDIAQEIAKLKTKIIRIAYDSSKLKDSIENATRLLFNSGVSKRKILVYTLYNYIDTPEDFLGRIRHILKIGAVAYPMRYEPLCVLKKNEFVSPLWDANSLNMVQKARRVIGYAGAFPPYKPLIEKLNVANDFTQAFALRPSVEEVKKTLGISDEEALKIYSYYKLNNLTTRQLPLEQAVNHLNGSAHISQPVIQVTKRNQKRLSGSLDWR